MERAASPAAEDGAFRQFHLSIQLTLTFLHSLHGLLTEGRRELQQTATLFISASPHI